MEINFLLVILLSFFSFFIVNIIFRKLGVVDKPDKVRKFHKGSVPLGGGIALFLSTLIAIILIIDLNSSFFDYPPLLKVFFVSIIILIIGLWDDIKPLPFSVRLIVQIFASWLVITLVDVHIVNLGNLLGFGNIYLSQLGIPVTIFMVVGVCNAFNMLDGMDGLLGTVVLVTVSALSYMTYLSGFSESSLLISIVITLIYLTFNLGLMGKRQKIFLGDAGSMWVGFMLAWTLVIFSQGETRYFEPVTALWFILIPLIDALSTFLTRLWNKKSMFESDRTHIHHMLLDSGFSNRKVLLIVFISSVVSACFGIYAYLIMYPEARQFYGFLTIWFFYALLIKYPLSGRKEENDI